MAVDAVRYRSRRRDENRAQKEKRQKIFLAFGLVVLLALGAFEGPKTLKKLHGRTAEPVTLPATAPTAATPAAMTTAAATHAKASLAAVHHLAVKDPFAVQLGAPVGSAPVPPTATPPAVRDRHFVAKDPFAQQLAPVPVEAVPAPAPSGAESAGDSSKEPAALAGGGFIVVLASIPVGDGRAAATHAAANARSQGVDDVGIVVSAKYPTLRTGFYAVYSGPYPTLGELLPALQTIRGQGYTSAYTRQLAH